MAAGRAVWTTARAEITALLAKDSSLKDNAELRSKVLLKQSGKYLPKQKKPTGKQMRAANTWS